MKCVCKYCQNDPYAVCDYAGMAIFAYGLVLACLGFC